MSVLEDEPESPVDGSAPRRDRAAELEERFSLPVIIAAIAAIPAVFLSMMDGAAQVTGNLINYATLAVFAAEFVTLLWAAEDKRRWVREHKFVILVLLAAIPAVILFVGAVQALRLGHLITRFLAGITHFLSGATHAVAGATRFLTGLKIARLRQLFRAFRKLREKTGLCGWRWNAVRGGFAVLGLVVLGMVLGDPDSDTRQFLDDLVGAYGLVVLVGSVLAVAALAAGGFVAYRRWRSRPES